MGYNGLSTQTNARRAELRPRATATSAPAAQYEGCATLALADGTRLALRRLRPADSDALAALFARLSPESRRRRFLSPKAALTARELAYFTDIDHVNHEAVAAVDRRDGSIVGVARYANHAGRASVAEVAVEVADDLHGMGIGTALVAEIVKRARANGFSLLTAMTLWENRPARALLRGLEFHARTSHGAEIDFELKLGPSASNRSPQIAAKLARMARTRRVRAVIVGVVAASLALGSTSTLAATITPNTTGDVVKDDGQCSLREAINSAFLHAPSGAKPGECPAGTGNDVIQMGPGRYLLAIPGTGEDADASGDLDIRSDLTIRGAGASSTTIDAGQIDRAIEVLKGVTATIEGVTITGGKTADGANAKNVVTSSVMRAVGESGESAERGGGILNLGALTLLNSTVTVNTTGKGGRGGEAIGENGQDAGGGHGGQGGSGGGIESIGPLTIADSDISGNATGAGGRGNNGFGGDGAAGVGEAGAAGGSGEGGGGGFGGGGAGLYAEGPLTISRSTISQDTTGAGGEAGLGKGGRGGTGASGFVGGAGGSGRGGAGGSGGFAAGVAALAGVELTASTIADDTAGVGTRADIGIGGEGGSGGSAANGGPGGEGLGGRGGNGGSVGGLFAEALVSIQDTTVVGDSSGAGGAGESAEGGSGGAGGGAGTPGKGGHSAGGDGGDGGEGGGLETESESTPSFVQDTIAANATGLGGAAGTAGLGGSPAGTASPGAPGERHVGGGLFVYGNATLSDSILASNSAGNCGMGSESVIKDAGHDISFGDASCPGANVDPQLGPLQANGGPTATEAIATSSPGRDAVPASGAGCLPDDQRGVSRPAGAACDIGAFELATPQARTLGASAIALRGVTLNGSAANPDLAGASASFQYGTTTAYGSRTPAQPIGARAAAAAFSASVTGLAPGVTYHFRAVVVNSAGTAFGADMTARTLSATHATATPALSGLAIHPTRVLPERRRGASLVGKLRRHHGALITYRDSELASSAFTVQLAHRGFRTAHGCAARPPRHHRGAPKRCTRYSTLGGFTHADRAGANRIRFSGRVHGRALKPGSYRLVVTPHAGPLHGRSSRVGFRIV